LIGITNVLAFQELALQVLQVLQVLQALQALQALQVLQVLQVLPAQPVPVPEPPVSVSQQACSQLRIQPTTLMTELMR
jgi:hypothetical protein